MSAKKKKTILRTIRLTEEIDEVLQRDAEEQNVSANALISRIMTRYLEWDRAIEKTSYVIISSILFRALINELSEQKLEEIGKNAVSEAIEEFAMVEFGKKDLDTLLNALLLIGKYDTGLRINLPLSNSNKVDGRYVITIYHDWGLKGSILFRGYFDNLVRNELGKQPTINITDDVVNVSFPKLSKSSP